MHAARAHEVSSIGIIARCTLFPRSEEAPNNGSTVTTAGGVVGAKYRATRAAGRKKRTTTFFSLTNLLVACPPTLLVEETFCGPCSLLLLPEPQQHAESSPARPTRLCGLRSYPLTWQFTPPKLAGALYPRSLPARLFDHPSRSNSFESSL